MIDESGGMAEIEAAKDTLTAAYGPGRWVTDDERTDASTSSIHMHQEGSD